MEERGVIGFEVLDDPGQSGGSAWNGEIEKDDEALLFRAVVDGCRAISRARLERRSREKEWDG